MRYSLEQLLSCIPKRDFQGFAQLLTWIERTGPAVLKEKSLRHPSSLSFRVGITGPPGAGKSTLIGQLIGELRRQGLTVGVIAVDPSSPFSHGAILGDRIRYSEHFSDPGVFIRSLGSRGSLGGLSAATYLMLRAFDLFQFDVVLIETVGVGQTELEVMYVADYVAVTLVPESGDGIQMMKAGLMEIADLFVINKADRPGAASLVREIEAGLLMSGSGRSQHKVEVLTTVATQGEGLAKVTELIVAARTKTDLLRLRQSPDRLKWEAQALLRAKNEQEILRLTESIQSVSDFNQLVETQF